MRERSFFAIEERLCVYCKRDPSMSEIQMLNLLPFPSDGYIIPGDRDNYLMAPRYQLQIFNSWQARDRWIEQQNRNAWITRDHHKYLACKAYPISVTQNTRMRYVHNMRYHNTFFRLWDDATSIAEYNKMLDRMLSKFKKCSNNEVIIKYLEHEYIMGGLPDED